MCSLVRLNASLVLPGIECPFYLDKGHELGMKIFSFLEFYDRIFLDSKNYTFGRVVFTSNMVAIETEHINENKLCIKGVLP